jgi:hypothetical protein
MGKGIFWACLFAVAALQAVAPAHAGKLCETIVEGATAVGGYLVARRAHTGEAGRTIGGIAGDKMGGLISSTVCATGTNPDNPSPS